MSDETERTLARLFAEAQPALDAAEPFVAAVSGRIARRRRAGILLRIAGSLGMVAGAVTVSPFLTEAATSVALVPVLVAEPLEAVLLSPAGWVAALLLSGLTFLRGSA